MRKKNRPQRGASSEYIVIGRNAVQELVRTTPTRVRELLVEGEFGKKGLKEICQEFPVRAVSKEELEARCGSSSHQGVAAICSSPPFPEVSAKEFFSSFLEGGSSLVIALDGVSDPQNLGSVLRSAECFGADGVLFPRDRSAFVTPAVTKVSAGASELVRWQAVSNLAEWLRQAKESGYWIVATAISEEAQQLFEFDWPEKVVVVLGAEGSGIRALTAKLSDFFLSIPMYGRIDSLNVAQASAVILAGYRHKFRSAH